MYFWKDPDARHKAMKQLAVALQAMEENVDVAFAKAARRLGTSEPAQGASAKPSPRA